VVAVLAVLIFSLVFYALLPYRRRAYVPILITTVAGFALGQLWDFLGLPSLRLGQANMIPAIAFAALLQPLARFVPRRSRELKEPQGVGYEPSSDTLYVANGGDGSVRLYRGADYAETGRIDLGDDADNIRIDADTKHILVGYGAGAIATVDPATRTKIADFRLPAHPEGFQFDRKTNQIFVNVPRAKAIVTLDAISGQRKAVWPMKDAGANFPMALDEDAQRVLVAFRSPAKLGVFSARDGESVASVELCGDADDLFVDVKRGRVYVSCGEGFLDVLDARDYRRLARVPTVRGARTSYYVPSMDRLFLAVRAASLEPAAVWVYRPVP